MLPCIWVVHSEITESYLHCRIACSHPSCWQGIGLLVPGCLIWLSESPNGVCLAWVPLHLWDHFQESIKRRESIQNGDGLASLKHSWIWDPGKVPHWQWYCLMITLSSERKHLAPDAPFKTPFFPSHFPTIGLFPMQFNFPIKHNRRVTNPVSLGYFNWQNASPIPEIGTQFYL